MHNLNLIQDSLLQPLDAILFRHQIQRAVCLKTSHSIKQPLPLRHDGTRSHCHAVIGTVSSCVDKVEHSLDNMRILVFELDHTRLVLSRAGFGEEGRLSAQDGGVDWPCF